MKRKQVMFRCCITFTYTKIVYSPDCRNLCLDVQVSFKVCRKKVDVLKKSFKLALKYHLRYTNTCF